MYNLKIDYYVPIADFQTAKIGKGNDAVTQGSISFRDANPGLCHLALSERGHLACKDINFALSGQRCLSMSIKMKIQIPLTCISESKIILKR